MRKAKARIKNRGPFSNHLTLLKHNTQAFPSSLSGERFAPLYPHGHTGTNPDFEIKNKKTAMRKTKTTSWKQAALNAWISFLLLLLFYWLSFG